MLENLELMRKRLEWQGGVNQEDRMIKDKWRTLQRVLKYSYQACNIQIVQKYSQILDASLDQIDPSGPIVRALINPDKNKQDYDDKILSVDYVYEFQPGDVFTWLGTDSQWIIYLRELTEDAYFRGEIRRCRYQIKFKDEDGNWCSTYAAIRGPVETQIESIQKNQERIDRPNLSLNILIPRNKITEVAFERYQEFLLDGRCWRVEAIDGISMTNIIEVNATEDYINESTDDIANEMKDGLVIEPINPTPDTQIQGETFILPSVPEIYTVGQTGGKWCYKEKNAPVRLISQEDGSVQVIWDKMTSGQFILTWTKDDVTHEKVIVVESLF